VKPFLNPLSRLGALLLWSAPGLAASVYTWEAPSVEMQLLDDKTAVPADKGAIFVPALTSSAAEPQVFLVTPDGVVPVRTGKRTVVAPGRYVVVASSADPRIGAGSPLVVVAGRTTVAPVTWGALKVESVDADLRRIATQYDLIHVDSGKKVQLPDYLETEEGVRTLLLKPGLYRLTEPGATSMSGPDFLTVHVPAGGLVHFRLFARKASGSFEGGGVIPADLALRGQDLHESDWTGSLNVGLDGTFSQTEHVPGMLDMTNTQGTVFADAEARYDGEHSALSLGLRVAEGQQWLGFGSGRDLPVIKGQDKAKARARYTFLFNEGVGLYLRGAGETQIFDTHAIAPQDLTIARRNLDGSVDYEEVAANRTYQISDAFSPMTLQTSAGLEVRVASQRWLSLSLYGGPGYRVNRYAGTYIDEDNPNTPAIEYTRLGDFNQTGLDVGLNAFLRLSGWLSNTTTIGTFWDIEDLDSPTLELENAVTLRITDFLSANYVIEVDQVPRVSHELQVSQGAFLRARWSLL
jgi:hypothetical protein